MSKCMQVCAMNFAKHFEEIARKDELIDIRKYFKIFFSARNNFINHKFYMKLRAFGCYSLDVISSCCFGIDMNSVKGQKSEFIKNLQIILENTLGKNPKFLLLGIGNIRFYNFIFIFILNFILKSVLSKIGRIFGQAQFDGILSKNEFQTFKRLYS